MKLTRRAAALGGLNLLSGAAMCTSLRADRDSPLIGFIEGGEEFWLATDAYIYGYPLVTMEMTRRIMTNVAAPEGNRAPMGQFAKAREYPNASFRDVTAHDGHGRTDLRNHRAGMEGDASRRRQGIQVTHQPRVDSRPHLLHRHARGLRCRPCGSRSIQAGTAERLRKRHMHLPKQP